MEDRPPQPEQRDAPDERGLYERVAELPTVEAQRIYLKTALRERVAQYQQHPKLGQQIAYEIASLLSLDTLSSLADGDPLGEALLVAGELELPAEHRSTAATWSRLSELVEQL